LDASGLSRVNSPACETTLGNVLADARLAATGDSAGAVMAFGGTISSIRADILPASNQSVDYAAAFDVQPFGNHLVTATLKGSQIRQILEGQQIGYFLHPSNGFSYSYTWNTSTKKITVDADSMTLNGETIQADATYRVTVDEFLM